MMSQKKRPLVGRSYRVGLLFCFALVMFSACPTGTSSGPCLTSDDCPEGELCIGTNCLGKPEKDATVATEPPPQPENTTPEIPAIETKGPDAPKPDVPTPDTPVGPDATPDQLTDTGTGTCRLDELRSCTHGCGTGTQRCRLGEDGRPTWDTCKPKETTRSCYNGPEDTAGVGPCKTGTQVCTGERWGPCENEVIPAKEVCDDGKDNDCNGKTDETEAGCLCKSGQSQACGSKKGECVQGVQACNAQNQWGTCKGSIRPQKEICNSKDDDCDGNIDNGLGGKTCTILNAKGLCAQGKEACESDKIVCKALNKPSAEVCDGKDNDCDGKVDDGIMGTGASCKLMGQLGECNPGTMRCGNTKTGYRIDCVANKSAVTEICRDGKDNDCDGKTDEICGPRNQMASINANGTVAFKTANIRTVKRVGPGSYEVTTADGCGTQYPYPNKVPMFVTARGSSPRATSYICSQGKYIVSVGATNPVDTPIYIAFPAKRMDEAYGAFSAFCNQTTKVCGLHYSQQGNATARQLSVGLYEVSSTACKSANQPYFAEIFANKPSGYATIYYASPGKCRVNTYSLTGTLANLSFAYWIPSTSAMAWASIDGTGKIVVSNIFGDQRAKWQASVKGNGGIFSSMEISFPAWFKSSTPLITPNTGGKYGITVNTMSGGIISYPVVIGGKRAAPPRVSVMFLQP